MIEQPGVYKKRIPMSAYTRSFIRQDSQHQVPLWVTHSNVGNSYPGLMLLITDACCLSCYNISLVVR